MDEKTLIQAREGIDPPDPAVPGAPMHIAARYTRKGALNLFALLSVTVWGFPGVFLAGYRARSVAAGRARNPADPG
ncbi:MAG: hypothetical protein HC837_10265 [Chloroflexaceae bacterium]|nr:hypothetical protein [Chloroflexaceae bacterium]